MKNFTKTILSGVQNWTKQEIKASTADWNQSDSNAVNYIKNRTHWDDRVFINTPTTTVDGHIVAWGMLKIADSIEFDLQNISSTSLEKSDGESFQNVPVVTQWEGPAQYVATYDNWWLYIYLPDQEAADWWWDDDLTPNPLTPGLYAGFELEEGEAASATYSFTMCSGGELHPINEKYLGLTTPAYKTVLDLSISDNNSFNDIQYRKLVGQYIVTVDGISEIVNFVGNEDYSFASITISKHIFGIETWDGGIWFNAYLDGNEHYIIIQEDKSVLKEECLPYGLSSASEAYAIAASAGDSAQTAQNIANNATNIAQSALNLHSTKMDKSNPTGSGNFKLDNYAATVYQLQESVVTEAIPSNGPGGHISIKFIGNDFQLNPLTGVFTYSGGNTGSYLVYDINPCYYILEQNPKRVYYHTSKDNHKGIGDICYEGVMVPYLVNIGNGTNSNTKSSAHTLQQDGTAWFANDIYVGSQSGQYHDEGSKKLITLDDITVTGKVLFDNVITFKYNENDRYYYFDTNLDLEENHLYKLIWNGTEVEMTAWFNDTDSSPCLNIEDEEYGDVQVLRDHVQLSGYNGQVPSVSRELTIIDLEENIQVIKEELIPSYLAFKDDILNPVQSNWNENNEAAPDYIKNRTHWIEYAYTDVLVDPIMEATDMTEDGVSDVLMIHTEFNLINGETYIVNYNGTDYECVAFSPEGADNGAVMMSDTNSEEPNVFQIGVAPSENIRMVMPMDGNMNITLSIKQRTEKVVPLDEKFIPFIQKDWNQNDATARDYIKGRTHWIDYNRVPLLEQTEVIFENGHQSALPNQIGFVLGEKYVVNFNGVDYECIATEMDITGIICVGVGDIYTATGGEQGQQPTGEPFIIADVPATIGAYLGIGVVLMSLVEIPSLTFSVYELEQEYKTLDPKFIEDMYYTETSAVSVVPAFTFGETSLDGNVIETPVSVNVDYVKPGQECKIILDGNEYLFEWKVINGVLCLGNAILAQMFDMPDAEDTGEPFLFYCLYNGDYNVSFAFLNTVIDKQHSIAVVCEEEIIHKIDSKYLPEANAGEAINIANEAKSTAEGAVGVANEAKSTAESAQSAANEAKSAFDEKVDAINEDIANKMNTANPVAIGSFSLNRKPDSSIGNNSVALGSNTTASGACSHAEGNGTTASEYCSHAEGNYTTASGRDSHAEGQYTTASGIQSHAEGLQTIAAGDYQHVQGQRNITDTEGKYAHIVGNGYMGEDYINIYSNAHTLDWEGNAWYSGDVYVGSTSGKNKDDGSKKLATEEFVTTSIENKQDKITDTLILADTITGEKYKIQIQNGQLVTSLIEEEV